MQQSWPKIISSLAAGLLIAIPALAVDEDPLIEESPLASSVYVGVTLGNNWSGFPNNLAVDYQNTGPQEHLNITSSLYVTWILDLNSSSTVTQVNPPQPITTYSSTWFSNPASFEVIDIAIENGIDNMYTACPQGQGLELPQLSSNPLTSAGSLHIEDTHGGIGTTTSIKLRKCTATPCTQAVILYVGWARPKTQVDAVDGTKDLVPGSVWHRNIDFVISGTLYHARYDLRTVEWVSADIGAASRRFVDAGDVAAWSWVPTGAVRWGLDSESPARSPTFQGDLNVDGYVDSGDIAQIASDLGKSCTLSKARPGDDPATILEWFGYRRNGATVTLVGGEQVPEWELADLAQNLVARNDPFGYRNRVSSAHPVPWSTVKGLYK